MSVFEKWFQREYEKNPAAGAAYLFHCCANGPGDSVAWEYLEETGDKKFTAESFYKASQIILEKKENE